MISARRCAPVNGLDAWRLGDGRAAHWMTTAAGKSWAARLFHSGRTASLHHGLRIQRCRNDTEISGTAGFSQLA